MICQSKMLTGSLQGQQVCGKMRSIASSPALWLFFQEENYTWQFIIEKFIGAITPSVVF